MFSLGRSSSSATDATAASAYKPPAPKLVSYLLPTFAIPFRSRRRQSSTTARDYGCSPPGDHAVPSLSSTPAGSAASSPVEHPPTPSLFPFDSSRGSTTAPDEDDPAHMARLTQTQPDTIRCAACGVDFAFDSQIVSKGFTGRWGRAYLVAPPDRNHRPFDVDPHQPHQRKPPRSSSSRRGSELLNVVVGKAETRNLATGSHVVADISCASCGVRVGWKYVDAKDESQRYKIGKFILETMRCVRHRAWEDVAPADRPAVDERRRDPLFALAPTPRKEDHEREAGDARPKVDLDAVVFDSDDEDECEDLFSGTWDPELAALRRSRKVDTRSWRG